MRDADADAAGARIERGIERLARLRTAREPVARSASPSSSATAIAPCSDVPQPVTTIGSPARAASRDGGGDGVRAGARAAIGSASPASASIISSITHGGPSRSSG